MHTLLVRQKSWVHYLIFILFSGVTVSAPSPLFSVTEEQSNHRVIVILMQSYSKQPLLLTERLSSLCILL